MPTINLGDAPGENTELYQTALDLIMAIFRAMPNGTHGTLLASLIMTVLVQMSKDPDLAWAVTREALDKAIPMATAMQHNDKSQVH